MPFKKGHSYHPPKTDKSKKTVWIMESLAQHGYDYEKTLVTFLERAAKGDRIAYSMAELLIKLVPHLANAPKHDAGVNQIETLVINRFDSKPEVKHIESEVVLDGHDNVHEGTPSEVTATESRPSKA